MEQETTFYEEMQNHSTLDLRDNRGKRHNLALVLLGLVIGLLRKRDGVLSSIHRSMQNTQVELCAALGIDNEPVVSRAHFPRLLMKVNRIAFEDLLFQHYGIALSEQEKQWFAGDGKELRGSIEKGDTRGEACVQIVRQEDRAVVGQAFYNGAKESEKPCLQDLVKQTGVQSQKITADALHLYPKLTELIHGSGGTFIIGLKGNQQELMDDMIAHAKVYPPKASHQKAEKGHGRIDSRHYTCFDISEEYFDSRWEQSGFSSLIKVERKRTILKNNKLSKEVSYYISNGEATHATEYFRAIRKHWSVEVNNHYRDVSLKEDQLRTKKSP